MRKTFIFFAIIIILAAGVFFAFKWKNNVYSKDVVKLEIFGPAEATIGEEVEYVVKYKNNSDFRLEAPELNFVPPENSLKDDGFFAEETLKADKLGEAIYPGEEKSFSFKMRLLGKEGEVKTVKAFLSYRPKNLKAKYESSTTFTTIIKAIPITFEFDFPLKIESGKEFNFRINYFSNVNYPLTDLRIQLDYPSDFEFINSNPKSIEKNEWDIPVLNKSEGGRIEITGKILGKVGEAKIFRGQLGIWKEEKFILLKEAESGVEIIKPSLYLRQEINGNPEYVASPGGWLHYEIYFKNIGDEPLSNLFMVNKLEGEAFDLQTIKSELGNFQAGNDSIIFDWRRVDDLAYLIPRAEGKIDFWVKLKDEMGNIREPILKNKVFISQIQQEFATKVSSKLEVLQKGYFQEDIFGNSGSIPPRVGETTTYTIVWLANNYYSDVKNIKAKAVLPENVQLTGKIFPEESVSKFSFDPQSREIIWSVGDLEKGKNTSIAFQIALTPNESQRGQKPEIIGELSATGEDTWTNANLKSSSPAIDTTLPDDQTVNEEMGKVQ